MCSSLSDSIPLIRSGDCSVPAAKACVVAARACAFAISICGLSVEAAEPMRRMAPYERQAVLNHCVRRFEERSDELALSLCIEAGKPIKDSRGEVSRLIEDSVAAATAADKPPAAELLTDVYVSY